MFQSHALAAQRATTWILNRKSAKVVLQAGYQHQAQLGSLLAPVLLEHMRPEPFACRAL